MKPLVSGRARRWPRPLMLVLLTLFGALQARAQTRATLTGTVQTAAGAAVEFATVTLHRPDSVVVKTEFSDEKGAFRFEQVPAGRYLVSTAQVGFVRRWTGPVELPAAGLALPVIALQASGATALKEVTVVGQKPLFERQADRTVVNVEGSTLAAGNTSLDVLARSPGVTVDGNDNLALRGKQGLLVLIDGKRQPMRGTELADYLRALPADQLKSIELITNPPAKYDAQGGAGIIAINLKKDQRQGTNGSVNAAYGRGYYGKFNGGLSMNHKQKDLNLFGSYSYANRNGLAKLDIHRDFYAAQDGGQRRLIGSSDQVNRLYPESISNSFKVGADYNLSEKTVVGAVLTGLDSRIVRMPGTNFTTLYAADGTVRDRYAGTLHRSFSSPNGAANLNFKHTFAPDSAGSAELTADADYARYRTSRLQDVTTVYALSGLPTKLVNSDQRGTLTIQSAKADYTRPLTKEARLEAGTKFSRVSSDNDVRFDNTVEGVRTPDLNLSNRFTYDERISAAYLNFNRSFGKLSAQAGLRGEQTAATGRQVVGDSSFSRRYFQLFPSASLKQTLNDRHEVSVSLSRRIDRPSYSQLNPFRVIVDPTTFGSGNPNLRPQTSYNIELNHTFKQKFTTGLSYSNTRNPIIDVVQPETDSTVLSTHVNLGRQHYYALTLTAPVEVAKWWTVYNNGVFYYNRFTGALAGTALNRGRMAYTLSSNSTFTFGKGWSAEVNGMYQSREQYGFFDLRPNGQLSLGVQKAVWDRKGTLKLNATDILFTNKTRAISAYDNYVERFYQRGDQRIVTLAFSYRFGNDKLAPSRRRSGGAEDEKRRAGGQ
ncbi:TonB-dependent receptor [Hymenobacter persicinus]|uniref:TonB-dependent receptor n=1 Tax=Hymenobacter persicinus TaxID=2025506 RepID=A0A4V1ZAP3_9BACT|nr:TonB-dependent receptor [Hymenobacter persicinus]RYU79059.1 TonB-dependent receptor [Hymenobacter persicinus]